MYITGGGKSRFIFFQKKKLTMLDFADTWISLLKVDSPAWQYFFDHTTSRLGMI